mmetsp:Transcript_76905/g.199972  ORF Transcript_76905/g.199972 Transcript_76905/m.199972 type:complete len:262 (-) Transcript_76905:2085-2870(-)
MPAPPGEGEPNEAHGGQAADANHDEASEEVDQPDAMPRERTDGKNLLAQFFDRYVRVVGKLIDELVVECGLKGGACEEPTVHEDSQPAAQQDGTHEDEQCDEVQHQGGPEDVRAQCPLEGVAVLTLVALVERSRVRARHAPHVEAIQMHKPQCPRAHTWRDEPPCLPATVTYPTQWLPLPPLPCRSCCWCTHRSRCWRQRRCVHRSGGSSRSGIDVANEVMGRGLAVAGLHLTTSVAASAAALIVAAAAWYAVLGIAAATK